MGQLGAEMSDTHLEMVQLAGGVVLILIALSLVWTYRHCEFQLFRYEALLCGVVAILISGIGRLALGLGLVSRSEMLTSTALLQFVPLTILAELVIIAYIQRDNPMLHGTFKEGK